MSEDEGTTFIDTSSRDNKPAPAAPAPSGKKRDGLYIILILLLLGGIGYLAYQLSESNKLINQCSNEKTDLENEMIAMNDMLNAEGMDMGDNVRQNLENMLTMYNQMESDNVALNDSMSLQKEKIQGLLAELEKAKGDKRYYANTVLKLQKETETLRSIMKDYIRTIDSLNTVNGVLTVDLNKTLENLDQMTESRNTYQATSEELTEKVNKGSKLTAFGFVSEGIKERSTGSYKEEERASRCSHIRSCFSLGENAIASAGNKMVYMRIISPSGSVLSSSNSNTLQSESGQSLIYSDKKSVNYQNKSVDLCIFYELGVEIEGGNYVTEIYCEGVKIGTDNFVLK